ncbi:MAG TPA: hypothetical protein VFS11_02025 [Gemmatimonadales bacterium]|nr:hypothetical protein [Gemmatimonadales bacterium]
MTYTFKLARRLAHSRRSAGVLASLLLLAAACTGSDLADQVGPDSQSTANADTKYGRLTGVELSPASVSLAPGATKQFAATARYNSGKTTSISVTYTATGGTITSGGLYTAGATAGTYRVIAKQSGGTLADTATVTITGSTGSTSPTLQSIVLTPATVSLQTGATQQFSASGKMSDGTTSAVSVTWTATGGTVSTTGLYTAGATAGTYRVIAASSGKADTSTVTLTTSTSTGGTTGCSAYTYTRLVSVSTASQLSSALANAQPGDLIKLADGTYTGRFTSSVSGSSTRPIVVCGSSAAVLTGGGVSTGTVLRLNGANYWTLDGFTVANGLIGVWLDNTSRATVRGLTLHDFGQEGLILKHNSKHNLVDRVRIYNTGISAPQYGEALYIGSTSSQWVNGQPDRSDSNTVRGGKFGPNIATEMVDIKDGSTGTVVQNNSFDGTGYSSNAAAWVNAYGNSSLITGNTGRVTRQHGYKVEQLTSGWGNNNVFRDNTIDLGGATGYGVYVGAAPSGNVIGCDNTMTSSGSKLTNRTCTP